MSDVDIVGVSKWFGEVRALDHVDLRVRSGERIAIAGTSGSGKTTVAARIGMARRPDLVAVRLRSRSEITHWLNGLTGVYAPGPAAPSSARLPRCATRPGSPRETPRETPR